MDHRLEACIGFVAAHCDAFELLQFAEEILHEVPPFVDFLIERDGFGPSRVLRDDDPGTTFVQLSDDPVGIEGLVGDQIVELKPINERGDANRVVSLPGHENEADEIAKRIR
jgi:hypothetical protein